MHRIISIIKGAPVLQIGLLVLGAVLIGLGLIRSETDDILRRAIFICLECIGLG